MNFIQQVGNVRETGDRTTDRTKISNTWSTENRSHGSPVLVPPETRNTVNRLGWSRMGLAVLILHAAGACLIGRPAVISGHNKCHPLQLLNHYAHFPPLQHTHTHSRKITTMRNWSWEMIRGFEALYAGRGRSNPVWSGKEAHWSLRELIVKSAEYCGADYKPSDRYLAIAAVLKWDCKMGLHRICIYPTIMFPRANVLSKQCGHGIWQLLNGTIYLSL